MLHQLTKLHYWTCLCICCFSLHRSQFSATLLLINILMFRVYFLLSLSCLVRSLCHLPGITIDSYLFLQSVLNIQAESLSCIIMAFFFLSTIYQCTVTSSYDHKASLLFHQDIFYFQNQPVKGIQSSLNHFEIVVFGPWPAENIPTLPLLHFLDKGISYLVIIVHCSLRFNSRKSFSLQQRSLFDLSWPNHMDKRHLL